MSVCVCVCVCVSVCVSVCVCVCVCMCVCAHTRVAKYFCCGIFCIGPITINYKPIFRASYLHSEMKYRVSSRLPEGWENGNCSMDIAKQWVH